MVNEFLAVARTEKLRRKPAQSPLVTINNRESNTLDHFRNEISDSNYDSRLPCSRPVSFDGFNETPSRFEHRFPQDSPQPSILGSSNSRRLNKRPPNQDFVKVKAVQNVWQTLVWPAVAICIPMVLLAVGLTYVVFEHRVKVEENVFQAEDERGDFKDHRYILVDYSATKLVFLASFLSTLAPLLAGCIMSLVTILIYQDLHNSSEVAQFPSLPTPYQTSLLIGILAASYEQFVSTIAYLWSSKRTAKASPVLMYAVSIFGVTIILGLAVAATDAYLHIATQTIEIALYSKSRAGTLALGKGLSSFCLNLDRLKNFGFPCSRAFSEVVSESTEWRSGQSEMQLIAHNMSSTSSIHLVPMDSGSVAYLLPARLPERTNFEAKTIGIGSKCELINPSTCDMTIWGENNIYTSFNCSKNFWGTLGMTPPEASIGQDKAQSPYMAFLAINQNANLIYNYFADESLNTVYNTADLNAAAVPAENAQPWNDTELVNPVYLGFAWRMATSSFANSSNNGMVSSDFVQKSPSGTYIDYLLSCEVHSYDVTYTIVNGTLTAFDAMKHENGTALNIWTSMADYTPRVSGSDWNLQDYNAQSAVAGNTTLTYEAHFGNLISQDALATIGAFTSEHQVVRQQDYEIRLVAKVPKSALGVLLACALVYPVLGAILLIKAKRASDRVGPMAPIFSYWGLTWAAFVQNCPNEGESGVSADMADPDEREEAMRIMIRTDDEEGSRFGMYKRSNGGHVVEVERSEKNVTTWI